MKCFYNFFSLAFLLILLFFANSTNAQTSNIDSLQKHKADSIQRAIKDSLEAPCVIYPQIPIFDLYNLDSVRNISRDNLPKNKPVLFVLFSPECYYCRHQINDILKNTDEFKNIQLVFVSNYAIHELKNFYNKYLANKNLNLIIGNDNMYFFPVFFRIKVLPFLALYDKNHKLVWTFNGWDDFSHLKEKLKLVK